MKPLKPPLRYLAERAKNGVPVPLADDIYWVRAALPFALDHVNIWLLRDAEGWTVIDCGYADDWTRSMWDGLLSGLLAGHPVRSVVATHFHPDHAGLAGWLVERTGAELVMSRSEWLTTRMLKLDDTEDFNEAGVIYDRQAGLDEEMVEKRRQRGNRYRLGVSLAWTGTSIAADHLRFLIVVYDCLEVVALIGLGLGMRAGRHRTAIVLGSMGMVLFLLDAFVNVVVVSEGPAFIAAVFFAVVGEFPSIAMSAAGVGLAMRRWTEVTAMPSRDAKMGA